MAAARQPRRDSSRRRSGSHLRPDATVPSLPEVFVGFVAPIGTKLSIVEDAAASVLSEIGYSRAPVHLTDYFAWALPDRNIPPRTFPVAARYAALMDAGDELRRRTDHLGAAVLPALKGIAAARVAATGDNTGTKPAHALAYFLHSLKTPEEVQLLRSIYGARLIVIAAYSPETRRRVFLEDQIHKGPAGAEEMNRANLAAGLVQRDQEGSMRTRFGQSVGDAFPLADCIVDADVTEESIKGQLYRFFSLLFRASKSNDYSPTETEQSMFLAAAAAVRSSSRSRQVGAVIVNSVGSVVSIGTNEVPRVGGGAYWEVSDEKKDGRTFRLPVDPAEGKRDELIRDLTSRLRQSGWAPPDGQSQATPAELVQGFRQWQRTEWQAGNPTAVLVDQLTEFNREVHAEMLAITDAAMRGVALSDCHLVTTTFPCDDCAKHAVAAGLSRITFLEPYAKSLIRDLHPDSLHVEGEAREERWDQIAQLPLRTFVGVAPRRYMTLFRMSDRRVAGVGSPRLRLADYEGAMDIGIEQGDASAGITNEKWVHLELLKRLEQGGVEVDESRLPQV